MIEYVWNLFGNVTPEKLNAIASFGTMILTLFLGVFAVAQIVAAKIQNRQWRTLEICNEYERNQVIEGAARNIFEAKRSQSWNDPRLSRDATIILNYLDSVAIGVNQGLYIENLAKDHLQYIVKEHVNVFLVQGNNLGLSRSHYEKLCEMHEKWSKNKNYYKSWWVF